ncbi:uncharacterized protein LOC5521120 isoform X2 [Nematostella vectensis]|uniref:uncharacterized protein LOC5521120 isoform X2 n=1 Tax=Nematostella vectensis TaxID=45351 RepID=UPI002077014E|nr:uncharacterized protein LOC5521120 isoform X2 [Nematostella vectensis]
MSGMTNTQFARKLFLAGGTSSVFINTWRRDGERAKRLLGYTAVSGLCGVAIGYTVAAAKRHSPYYHALYVGGNYFAISGTFLVFRDSILSTFGSGGKQLFLDQSQDTRVHVLLAKEPMPQMFASAAAGGSTGLLFSLFFWKGVLPTVLHSAQGIGLAVFADAIFPSTGQFVYDKFRIWRLEKTIEYHYPELTGNTKPADVDAETMHWTKRLQNFLGGKSYSSRLNDEIRSTEIQLELLEEEECELLKKMDE